MFKRKKEMIKIFKLILNNSFRKCSKKSWLKKFSNLLEMIIPL